MNIKDQREFPVDSASLKKVRNFARELFNKVSEFENYKEELVLALAEAAQNIVKHAYNGNPSGDVMRVEIQYENKVLITKRQNTKFLSGLWEFPGGKIEKHETAVQAIIREVKEETNLTISNPLFLGNVSHKYSHFGVNISLFISFPKSIKSLNLPQEHQWIRMKDILNYPLPKANHKMLDILKKLD